MSIRRLAEPLVTFLVALGRFTPRKTALVSVVLVFQGLMEGVGLVLLVPFLILVGKQSGGISNRGVVAVVEKGFSAVGLPMNLRTVLVTFVVLVTLRSFLMTKSGVLLNEIQLGYVNSLRGRIFGALGKASWRFLVRKRLSDLVHAMAQDISRVSVGTREALDLLATALLVLVYGLAALRISPLTTLSAMGLGVVLELIRAPLIGRARELGEAMTAAQREAFSMLTEFVQGLKPIKARGLEDRHHAAFLVAIERIETQRLLYSKAALHAHFVHQVLLAVALAVLIFVSATELGVSTAELLVVVFIFARLMPLMSKLHQGYSNASEALPALESALRICDELEAQAEAHGEASAPLRLDRELRLHDVTLRYDGGRAALDGVDVTLEARQTLAVIGPSGAGKTTLVDVVMGLLVPDEGMLLVDGEPLVGSRLLAWRQSVAYVPQETFLLHDSIEANLRWMTPDATEADLWDALRRAAAADFVRRLPEGLATPVGDRGTRLSGGERQRIALARALLTKPQLLILDEATSQLDAANERHILDALRTLHGDITIIIIAHRPTLLKQADMVLCLDHGRVTAYGPSGEVALHDGRLAT